MISSLKKTAKESTASICVKSGKLIPVCPSTRNPLAINPAITTAATGMGLLRKIRSTSIATRNVAVRASSGRNRDRSVTRASPIASS